MKEYLIYGKRTGLVVNGEPVYDKTFKALDSFGRRVTRLSQAMSYASKEDAEELLQNPSTLEKINAGLVKFDIRPAK